MADKRIILDGKVLEGIDQYGEWGVHTMEGWWDSPAEKTQQVSREHADGDYDLPVHYQSRYVTLTGIFIADNEAKMFQGMNRFTGLLRSLGRLQVVGYGVPQWANVRRSSGLTITPATDTICRWQARVKAPDSRKFGDRATFDMTPGSTVTVFHRGNYDATPVIQINGPLTGGATITHPFGQYTFLGDLALGGWVRVDMNTGRLKLNGNDRSDLITRADLCTVPPGSTAPFSINRGTGYVEIYDSYI